ncbi:unnamed protein product [Anisakis simplex]|uniref:Putative zinc finger protein (inferred by orthology to a C. elegans protein) n=1 Tax=Anisakis simplex TaxID=6269 RepID=A0A0M3JQY2_ANISI|nr:unnamed protein product [Anisakis simplex]
MFPDVCSLQNHTIGDHMNLSSKTDNDNCASTNGLLLQNGNTAEDVSFVCQQCDATLSSFAAFGQHMRTHLTSEHEQKCHLCNISFNNSQFHAINIFQRRLTHMVEHFTGNSTRIICKECPSSVFFSAHQIRQHHLDTHLEILYRCAICQKIFHTQNRFQDHLSVHNEEIMRYHCVACNTPFDTHDLLKVHVQLIHDRQQSTQQLQCLSVATVTSTTEIVTQQSTEATHTPPATSECRSVKCSVCDIRFESEDDLDFHRLNVHCKIPRADRCAECQVEITSIAQFLEHIRLHTINEQNVTCVVCRQALRNEAQIHSHANFHLADTAIPSRTSSILMKNESDNESRCTVCNQVLLLFCSFEYSLKFKVFSSSEALRLHASEHSKNADCPYCAKAFSSLQALMNHVSTAHSDARPIFTCQSCHHAFHFVTEFQQHKCIRTRYDTPPAIFLTERILSTFRDAYSPLGQHTITNATSPSYQCPFCPKMFGSESALQGHSHVHSSKAYRCDLCTLSFSSSARLETHRRKHFSEKDFTCQICDLKFHSRDDLKAHMRMHGGNLSNPKAVLPVTM